MIALNEIKNNPKFFEEKFKAMDKETNLKPILSFGENLSKLQQSFEQTKSILSKLSSTVTDLRVNNKSITQTEKEIDSLNQKMEKIKKQYDRTLKKINRLLKKLPNPATNENTTDVVITKFEKNSIQKQEFFDFLDSFLKVSKQKGNLKTHLKLTKNQIEKENNLPQATILDNEILLSTTVDDLEIIKNKLLNFVSQNSINCTQVSIKNLNFYSSETYIAKLNDNFELKIEIIGEYFAREFSLKYFDSQKDVTKFINQIKITI